MKNQLKLEWVERYYQLLKLLVLNNSALRDNEEFYKLSKAESNVLAYF